jgi:hypothetical protein
MRAKCFVKSVSLSLPDDYSQRIRASDGDFNVLGLSSS